MRLVHLLPCRRPDSPASLLATCTGGGAWLAWLAYAFNDVSGGCVTSSTCRCNAVLRRRRAVIVAVTAVATVLARHVLCLRCAFCLVGISRAGAAARQVLKEKKEHTKPPVSLVGQLLWREFFYCAAALTPNFHRMAGSPICRQIPWDDNEEFYHAWDEARTGAARAETMRCTHRAGVGHQGSRASVLV